MGILHKAYHVARRTCRAWTDQRQAEAQAYLLVDTLFEAGCLVNAKRPHDLVEVDEETSKDTSEYSKDTPVVLVSPPTPIPVETGDPRGPNVGEIWKHTTSQRAYYVLGITTLENNCQVAVRYVAVDGTSREWVRTVEDWFYTIDQAVTTRFTRVNELLVK